MPLAAGMYYFENDNNWARPAVILIHGAGGSHLYWPPEIRRLKNQRVYAIDLPGHGKSEGIGRQSIVDYAHSVLEFMGALKIQKAVFVGHSMGGAVALWLGIHNPSRTLGMGLISTAPRLRVSSELLSSSSVAATLPLAVKASVEMSFGPHADPRLKELAAQRMAEVRYPVLYGDFLACSVFDESNLVGRAKAPALIICGTEDKMTPLRYSEAMHRRLKKSIFHPVEGAGHMVMLEQPLMIANILDVFLNEISYQPGSTS
ncbi:MAG TPA: alpha/beta hydrolase [Anaerolineales bacterium]|jgi:pimeloyl-ACP methyl ester carboxylesterase